MNVCIINVWGYTEILPEIAQQLGLTFTLKVNDMNKIICKSYGNARERFLIDGSHVHLNWRLSSFCFVF